MKWLKILDGKMGKCHVLLIRNALFFRYDSFLFGFPKLPYRSNYLVSEPFSGQFSKKKK